LGRTRPGGKGPARTLAIAAVSVAAVGGLLVWLWVRQPRIALARDANRNVLLVTIDTLRADALGSYGGQAATPNLDRLAREGLRFTTAHAHSVVTLPSHTSILTGVYPFVHGVRDNAGYRLAPGATTMATLLKQAGYATGAFVGAFPLDARWGLTQGFDAYDDRYGGTNRLGDFLMPERRADAVVDAATQWIRQQPGKWFAWIHVYDPHGPYQPPAPFDRQYSANPYAGEVAYTDRELGPLFDLARSAPRDTLIVVTSDHGEALGSHGEQTHGLFAYEPTLHVPLILDLTQRPHALGASSTDVSARHIDLLPTVLDALGLQVPDTLPGRSLVRALEAHDAARPASYFESLSPFLNRGWAPLTGVIVGAEKYVDLPIPELYDLASDPREEHNLLPARDDRRRALEARLREIAAPGATASGARIQENAVARRQLQALGYVSGAAPPKSRYTADDDPKRLVDLDRMMQDGVTLFQGGQLRDALNLYRKVIARRPGMSASRLHAAYIEWELGDPRAAIDTLRQGLQVGADAPDMRVQLGIYLAEGGSPQEAVRLLEPLQQDAFPDLDGLNGLGIALAHIGRQADALAVFDRILQLDPNNASAYQNKGTIYLERGNLGAAREALTRALQRDPDLARALNGLGVVEVRSGNRRAAIEPWKRAVEVDPRQYDTLFNLGFTLLELGDRAAARQYFEQFVRTAPPVFYRKDIEKVTAILRRL
jgi:arylsulfatase A-like enzyme/Tfp pilus assembly protein PilF